ncbi:hypothetical protein N7466_010230 [Penicillium verhagenii]|uniref:uncharacterized protein n=1 Tax=Penicillium verhagenii TaxID=1562060 RepID=UPI00254510BF|nr:uncharacterized protein N7466_010230 [Penicillium verhagenii]KAJ5919287.1 hypothetical protein N7466_010230 [Penicillium verhagenii]
MAEANINPLVELIAHAFYYFDQLRPHLSLYSHLLVSAMFPLWISAHASLSRPSSAAKPPKKSDKDRDDDENDDDDDDEDEQGPVERIEGLQPSDALMFPLTAGISLCSLYMAIKWLEGADIVNKILGFYFSQVGVFFSLSFLKDIMVVARSLIFPKYYRHGGVFYQVDQSEHVCRAAIPDKINGADHVRYSPLPGVFGTFPLPGFALKPLWAFRNAVYQRLKLKFHVRGLFNLKSPVGLLDLLSGIVALAAVGYFQFVEKPWWLTNFLGFGFSYGALQLMSPTTFGTGSLILMSLFFYDIYFVFYTPVMVTVAKSLDVPIKLMFPRTEADGMQSHAMLGLGDIVIPGMMVCLALRFDLFLYYQRKGAQKAQIEGPEHETAKPEYQQATGSWGERFWAPSVKTGEPEIKPPYHDARSFPKVYFKASLVGYFFGMVATLLIMQYFHHAQPALLYLVPGILISLWGTALFRGEVSQMSDFSDAEEEEEEEEEEKEEKQDSANDLSDQKTEAADGGIKGFFTRILSGDMTVFGSKPEDKRQKDVKKKTAEKSDADKTKSKDVEDDLSLISFSLSFSGKRLSKEKSTTNDGQPVMFPGPIDDDDERPLKKRRGTPRKPT